MKYFLGGASGIRAHLVPDVAAHIHYRLLSMHRSFKGNTKVWCAVSHHPKSAMKEIMLDSGAFTAFHKGHKITVDELTPAYDEVIRTANKKVQLWFINLDVIPGKPGSGRAASPQEIREALDQSDLNFKHLQKKYGKERVLPVYHQTEDEKRMMEVIKMAPFVAFSFRQDFAEQVRINHAETVLTIARFHQPKVIIHGLATTGYKMLARASFDTVDSASWLYSAAMGGILTISEDGRLSDLPISRESPAKRIPRGHFDTITKEEQNHVLKKIQECGATLDQVQSDLSYRILVNAHQMGEWMKVYKRPVMNYEAGLFPL